MKGIDLYKKVLEKDESILGKKFFNSEFGEITSNNSCMYLNKDNVLCSDLLQIEKIMLAEWEEVQESVDFMTAINSGKKIKPVGSNFIYLDLHGLQELFNGLNEAVMLKFINGKWLME